MARWKGSFIVVVGAVTTIDSYKIKMLARITTDYHHSPYAPLMYVMSIYLESEQTDITTSYCYQIWLYDIIICAIYSQLNTSMKFYIRNEISTDKY